MQCPPNPAMGEADSSLSGLPLVQKRSWPSNPANGGLQNLLDSILSLVRTLMMIKYPNMLNLPKSKRLRKSRFHRSLHWDSLHFLGFLNFNFYSIKGATRGPGGKGDGARGRDCVQRAARRGGTRTLKGNSMCVN